MSVCTGPRRIAFVASATGAVAVVSAGVLVSLSKAVTALDGGSTADATASSMPAPTAPADVRPIASAAPAEPQPVHSSAPAAPRPVPVPLVVKKPAPAVHVSTPRPAVKYTPPPPPQPTNYHNRLVSADGTLNTAVGYYTDCSGAQEVPHDQADVDTCLTDRVYFVGHNPGVFTPLMHMGPGDVITYWDGSGNAHQLRIVAARTWQRAQGVPALVGGATVEFQACITSDGAVDRILDAVSA